MNDDENYLDPFADDDVNRCVAELDFGESPPDMLVVREVIWTRFVGIAFGLLVAIPVSWLALFTAVKTNDIRAGLIVASVAVVPLGGTIWLIYQILNRTFYYVAMDSKRYYRRWGPRRLECFLMRDLGPFSERGGVLVVEHRSTKKKLVVIKHSYSPERLPTLTSRLNAWCTTPPELRERLMTFVNVIEARDARTAANRQILRGLRYACLYPFLIVISVKFGLFGNALIALWGFISVVAALHLIVGIVKRLTVPPLRPPAENTLSEHPSSASNHTDL